jgi:hypothetical protein
MCFATKIMLYFSRIQNISMGKSYFSIDSFK